MHVSQRSLFKVADTRTSMREADAAASGNLTFYPSIMCQVALPSSRQPGSEYSRSVGPYRLSVLSPIEFGIPFGIYARGILNHIATETVRAKNQEQSDPRNIVLGASLTEAVQRITGKSHTSGGPKSPRELLDGQLLSLVNSTINFRITGPDDDLRGGNMNISSSYHARPLWRPQLVGKESPRCREISIRLGEDFYKDLLAHATPIDERIMKALWPHCLRLDIYTWITYRANFKPGQKLYLRWSDLMTQFGAAYDKSSERRFRQQFREAFTIVQQVYHPYDREYIKLEEQTDGRLTILAKGPSVASRTGTYDTSSSSSYGLRTYYSQKPKPPQEGQSDLF